MVGAGSGRWSAGNVGGWRYVFPIVGGGFIFPRMVGDQCMGNVQWLRGGGLWSVADQ